MANHIMTKSIPESDKNELGYPTPPSRDRTGKNITAGWVFAGYRLSHGRKKALWIRQDPHPDYITDDEEE